MRVHPPHHHSPKWNQIPMSAIAATVNYRKFGRSEWVDATLAQSLPVGVYKADFVRGR
jgi:hypothetical protein